MGAPGGVQIPGHQHGVPPPPQQHPSKRSKCRQLFRSPSMPSSVIRPILKRIERPHSHDTPIKSKRRRSLAGTPGEATEPVGDRDDEQGGGLSPSGVLLSHAWAVGGVCGCRKHGCCAPGPSAKRKLRTCWPTTSGSSSGTFPRWGCRDREEVTAPSVPAEQGGGAAGPCWATSRHHKPYLHWWEQPLTPRTSCPADIPAADGGGQAPGPQVHLPRNGNRLQPPPFTPPGAERHTV